jgi:hypothetical protein
MLVFGRHMNFVYLRIWSHTNLLGVQLIFLAKRGLLFFIIVHQPSLNLCIRGNFRKSLKGWKWSPSNQIIKRVFGTALLPFFQLRSTNSTMEQLHRGVRGADATP